MQGSEKKPANPVWRGSAGSDGIPPPSIQDRARAYLAVSRVIGRPAAGSLVRIVDHFVSDDRSVNEGLIMVCAHGGSDEIEHEANRQAFRWAYDNLLNQTERNALLSDFDDGGLMSFKVREALAKNGVRIAGQALSHPRETAAHAYALHCAGRLDVAQIQSGRVFARIRDLFREANAAFWGVIEKTGGGQPDPAKLFDELRSGSWIRNLPPTLSIRDTGVDVSGLIDSAMDRPAPRV